MSLMESIRAEQLQARKDKDGIKSALLTTLLGEAANVGKNAGNRETTDDEVVAVVKKFLKGINETIKFTSSEGYRNDDALSVVQREKELLEKYLPKYLTVEEIQTLIKGEFPGDTLAAGSARTKQVMQFLKEKVPGQYDGKDAITAINTL